MCGFTIREARREDCKEIRRLIQELADFEKMPDGPKIDEDAADILVLHAELTLFQELANYSHYPEDPVVESVILEEDGFNSEHPYFYCFVAESSTEDSGDAIVPNNGELFETGACAVSKAGAGDDCDANALLGYALYFYTYSTWKGKALYLEDLYITPGCRGQGLGSALFNRVAKRAFESHCCRLDFAVLNWNPAQDFYKAKGAVNITEQEGWHHYRLDREALAKLALEVNKADVTNE